jgi:hypothetical protein
MLEQGSCFGINCEEGKCPFGDISSCGVRFDDCFPNLSMYNKNLIPACKEYLRSRGLEEK